MADVAKINGYDIKDASARGSIANLEQTKADNTIADVNHTGLFSKSDYRRFDNLIKASKGIVYDEEIDTTEAYGKSVPSGAQRFAILDKIGGKSVVQSGQIISAQVQSVETKKADTTALASYSIPSEIKALDGYGLSAGSVYNEVDFAGKKFIKRVGSLTFTSQDNMRYNGGRGAAAAYNAYVAKNGFQGTDYKNIICDRLESGASYDSNKIYVSKSMQQIFFIVLKSNLPNVTDDSSNSEIVDAMKNFLFSNGDLKCICELAEPVETDISAYLTDDNYIEVEAGGTITFTQQTGVALPVPNQETYVIKVADAI